MLLVDSLPCVSVHIFIFCGDKDEIMQDYEFSIEGNIKKEIIHAKTKLFVCLFVLLSIFLVLEIMIYEFNHKV